MKAVREFSDVNVYFLRVDSDPIVIDCRNFKLILLSKVVYEFLSICIEQLVCIQPVNLVL